MSEKIYLADKKTLDEVNKNTNIIKEQFPISSGGIDWSKYTKFSPETITKIIEKNQEVEFIKINGEGYINYALFNGRRGITIDLIIDGQKHTIEFEDSYSYKWSGFVDETIISVGGVDSYSHPRIFVRNIEIDKMLSFPNKIFFKKSLKVVAKKPKDNNDEYRLQISGGVKTQ